MKPVKDTAEDLFESKIPSECWSTIWGWHCSLVTLEEQVKLLKTQFGVVVSVAPLRRLILKMIADRNAVVSARVAEKAVADIDNDLSKLTTLEDRLETLMKKAVAKDDDNLLLKTSDRQIKLLQLKFAISANNKMSSEDDLRESLAEGLLGKLAKRS